MKGDSPMEYVLVIATSIVGSSAIFGFIQFLITRKDNRRSKIDSMMTKLDTLNTSIHALSDRVDRKDDELRAVIEENKAVTARVRILQASDEIRHKLKHSKEWFDQINEDITFYEAYCAAHPQFKNNQAVHAIANVNEVYANALRCNDFLQ